MGRNNSSCPDESTLPRAQSNMVSPIGCAAGRTIPTLCCVLARDVDKMGKTSFGTFLSEQKGVFRHLLIT